MESTTDGTTYRTETAFEIATFGDGRQRSDPLHVFETLYRGPKGAWFIHRRQGGVETILPLTPKESQAWLGQKNLLGQLARWFGEPVRKTRAVA